MSTATVERNHGFTPPSGADLTPIESTNPFIKGYLVLKPGIDRMAGFRDRITTTLTDTFSQPLTAPSLPLRDDEYPSKADIETAHEATLQPESWSWVRRWAIPTALTGTTGLLAFACAPQEVKKPAIVEPAQPTATAEARATATAIGVGQVLVPTGNKEIDDIGQRLVRGEKVDESDILKWNAAISARAESTATAEAKKTLQCDILSPEACAGGEYIEWNRPDGEKLKGVGFVLKPGEEARLPKEGLLVSTTILQQPDVYRGVRVIAKTPDNSETYQYYGNLSPDKLKKSDLPPNTVGIIADSDLTVFEGWPYNLIFKGPDTFMERFVPITKNPVKVINNKVPDNQASNIPFFYGLTPPK